MPPPPIPPPTPRRSRHDRPRPAAERRPPLADHHDLTQLEELAHAPLAESRRLEPQRRHDRQHGGGEAGIGRPHHARRPTFRKPGRVHRHLNDGGEAASIAPGRAELRPHVVGDRRAPSRSPRRRGRAACGGSGSCPGRVIARARQRRSRARRQPRRSPSARGCFAPQPSTSAMARKCQRQSGQLPAAESDAHGATSPNGRPRKSVTRRLPPTRRRHDARKTIPR